MINPKRWMLVKYYFFLKVVIGIRKDRFKGKGEIRNYIVTIILYIDTAAIYAALVHREYIRHTTHVWNI